jgi:hypothetical protein
LVPKKSRAQSLQDRYLGQLRKGSKERQIRPGETFSYNSAFTHKLYRITVSQISPKEFWLFGALVYPFLVIYILGNRKGQPLQELARSPQKTQEHQRGTKKINNSFQDTKDVASFYIQQPRFKNA